MTITAHVAVGCAVGLATGNPAAAFFAGWVSHHLADAIPHSDLGSAGGSVEDILKKKNSLRIVFIDIFLSFAVFLFVSHKTGYNQLVFWGVLGSILPDLVDNSPFWSVRMRNIFPANYFHLIHETIHCTIKKTRFFWVGAATQLIVGGAAFFYIFR